MEEGSVAHKSGEVHVGDELISINNLTVHGLTKTDVLAEIEYDRLAD